MRWKESLIHETLTNERLVGNENEVQQDVSGGSTCTLFICRMLKVEHLIL